VRALRVAAWFLLVHGVLASILGIGALVVVFSERHHSESDPPGFAFLAVVPLAFAGWTWMAARRARGPWLVSRALTALLLLVLYALAALGSLQYARVGSLGSSYFAIMTALWIWAAIPEALVVLGAIAVWRAPPSGERVEASASTSSS